MSEVTPDWQNLQAKVIRGHQVASGQNRDPRFPGGTLAMQAPFFQKRGLDLDGWFLSTLNLSIAPFRYEIVQSKFTFREVDWHPTEPAEDFSFFDCRVRPGSGERWVDSLIYYPHPETKPEHFQPADVLEVIASEFLDGVDYETTVDFQIGPDQIRLLRAETF